MSNLFSTRVNSIHEVRPFRMAALLGGGTVILIVLLGFTSSDPEVEWLIALVGIVLFAWMIAVVGFFNRRWKSFFWQAILSYFILNVVLLGTAHLVSTAQLSKLPEFQQMLQAATLFFVVSLFMSKFIQSLVKFVTNH